ncbi:zinc transporter 10 isoform X1 [Callorhinchus milii]|uniref:Solute carrier family 30 member 10 n=1 Tax=Callorhinchus milii TaxID=7868 RepID=V9KSQ1_CALMI|nr:zinc transporter 10 isoform X1 [Callorhinchus milii]|eukprot:gi/632972552/ref/XP_007902714.1/ PREDICTED: zinc transporter 10 [Callorhinchus milii]
MRNTTCRLSCLLTLTASCFVAELVSGNVGQSLTVLSDAFTMLSDSMALLVGLIVANVSKLERRNISTYGFARAEVVGALGNAAFLIALHFTILVEAISRMFRPLKMQHPKLVLIMGMLGLTVNVIGLVVLLDCSCLWFKTTLNKIRADVAGDDFVVSSIKRPAEGRLNIRGILLHVTGDALGSIVVLISGIIFYMFPLDFTEECNWKCYVDPSLTILMVIIVVSSAIVLIKEVAIILLQAVPKNIDVEDLDVKLGKVRGLKGFHELHVWELADGKNIASIHIKCVNSSTCESTKLEIRKIFHNLDVHSVTIQTEFIEEKISTTLKCNYPCILHECEEKMCCSRTVGYVWRPDRRPSCISRMSFGLESGSGIFSRSSTVKLTSNSEEISNQNSSTSLPLPVVHYKSSTVSDGQIDRLQVS